MSEPLLTPRQAAARLGWSGRYAGQRLRRHVLAREAELGREILVRVGGGRVRPTYRISWPALLESCPELFDERLGLAESVARIRVAVEGLRKDLRRLRGVDVERIQERIAELDARVGALAVARRR